MCSKENFMSTIVKKTPTDTYIKFYITLYEIALKTYKTLPYNARKSTKS